MADDMRRLLNSPRSVVARLSQMNVELAALLFMEVMEENPSVTTPVTVSSLGDVKVISLTEMSNIQQDATPTREPYQEQQGMSQEIPVCRKRKRSNNELSKELQSYFERNLAIQEAMLAEQKKRTKLLEKLVENLRKS